MLPHSTAKRAFVAPKKNQMYDWNERPLCMLMPGHGCMLSVLAYYGLVYLHSAGPGKCITVTGKCVEGVSSA
jgi:hypothetical protein